MTPRPGPHKKFESIPLAVILRDILHVAATGSEAEKTIRARKIFVDGKARKDPHYPAGLFDVISFPGQKKNYRIVPSAKGLQVVEISESEAKKKIAKIVNKTVIKKGKLQLNLHDGKNLLADGDYKTGDSLLLQLPELKIIEHLKLEKGNLGIVSKGVSSGKVGTIKEIIEAKASGKKTISVDLEGTKEEVLADRFFVIGKESPAIKLGE